MTWAEYYDKFYDWSESTQINRLSSVKDFGPASEVCEIAEAFCDEKIASRLIRKALAAGVKFSSEDVTNLEGVVTDGLFMELTHSLGGSMSWELFYEHFYDWKMSCVAAMQLPRINSVLLRKLLISQLSCWMKIPRRNSLTTLSLPVFVSQQKRYYSSTVRFQEAS